jgi:hypothetical protein
MRDALGNVQREYVYLGDIPVMAVRQGAASGGAEVVVDNGSAGFTVTGTWSASTAVAGYLGANYATHEANGVPPGAIAVDNSDPGFSVTGTWTASTAIAGYLGSNYQHQYANGESPSALVADNLAGSFTGTWPASTSVSGYLGTNYQVHAAGTGASVFTWTLNVPSDGTGIPSISKTS